MSRAERECICRGKAGRTRMHSTGKGRGEAKKGGECMAVAAGDDGPACIYFRVLH